jgi:hypothetical protein
MSTQNEATREVVDFFIQNQGEHDLEAVVFGAEVTKTQANRALSALVKDGELTVTGTGTDRRWAKAAAPEPGDDQTAEAAPTAPGGDEAEVDSAATEHAAEAVSDDSAAVPAASEESEAPASATAAESKDDGPGEEEPTADGPGFDSGDRQGENHDESDEGESESEESDDDGEESAEGPMLPVEPEPDPDPQVLHIARTIADLGDPFDTQTLCNRAYLPTKRRTVTNILRALAEHGLVSCSKPFAPDADDAVWELVYDGPLMDAAIRVQVADAPDHVTCDVCGQTKTFGGAPRPRQAGTGVRNDGKTYLAAGELTGYVIDWVTDPQNLGEQFTVRQITKELVAAHPGKVSDNSDGAIKNALDKMLRPDHRRLRYNDRALVSLVQERGPRLYRALGV